jgi:hypothetical protein
MDRTQPCEAAAAGHAADACWGLPFYQVTAWIPFDALAGAWNSVLLQLFFGIN